MSPIPHEVSPELAVQSAKEMSDSSSIGKSARFGVGL
jgi:hypothetical protein